MHFSADLDQIAIGGKQPLDPNQSQYTAKLLIFKIGVKDPTDQINVSSWPEKNVQIHGVQAISIQHLNTKVLAVLETDQDATRVILATYASGQALNLVQIELPADSILDNQVIKSRKDDILQVDHVWVHGSLESSSNASKKWPFSIYLNLDSTDSLIYNSKIEKLHTPRLSH